MLAPSIDPNHVTPMNSQLTQHVLFTVSLSGWIEIFQNNYHFSGATNDIKKKLKESSDKIKTKTMTEEHKAKTARENLRVTFIAFGIDFLKAFAGIATESVGFLTPSTSNDCSITSRIGRPQPIKSHLLPDMSLPLSTYWPASRLGNKL